MEASSSDTIYSVCFWKNSIDLVGLIFARYAVRAICAEYADSAGCVAMVFHWRYYLSVQLFTGVIGGLTQPPYRRKAAAVMRRHPMHSKCLLMLAGAIATILSPAICGPVCIECLHDRVTAVFGNDGCTGN